MRWIYRAFSAEIVSFWDYRSIRFTSEFKNIQVVQKLLKLQYYSYRIFYTSVGNISGIPAAADHEGQLSRIPVDSNF